MTRCECSALGLLVFVRGLWKVGPGDLPTVSPGLEDGN